MPTGGSRAFTGEAQYIHSLTLTCVLDLKTNKTLLGTCKQPSDIIQYIHEKRLDALMNHLVCMVKWLMYVCFPKDHDHPCICACIQSRAFKFMWSSRKKLHPHMKKQAQPIQYMLADVIDTYHTSDLGSTTALNTMHAVLYRKPYPHSRQRKSM